jgi:hypothetical protein
MIPSIFQNTAERLTASWKYATVINSYHDFADPHELNILARFADAAATVLQESTSFYEVMTDRGRIDLVILSREAIFIVEGKTNFLRKRNEKINSLNEQIERIHGTDESMRRLIDEKIPEYYRQRWNVAPLPPLYAVALSWSHEKGLDAWKGSEKWSQTLLEFDSGHTPFTFGEHEHYLLYKFRKSSGTAWS